MITLYLLLPGMYFVCASGRYAIKYGKVASSLLKKQMAELPIGAVSVEYLNSRFKIHFRPFYVLH